MTHKERILSSRQLKKLSKHRYFCCSKSLVDPWLQPYWNWLVCKTPLWLAPNLITLIGLIVNVVTSLILITHSPGAIDAPPRWTCFLCGFGLFVYQSLDAIDGKQARRTRTSSPLGELFDHGCDSISAVFVILSVCISCQLGRYPNYLLFLCFCAITLFYCAHWQTYATGIMKFGKIDVTEAELMFMAIHMISFFYGPEIWMTKIYRNLELWSTFYLMIIVGGILSLYDIFSAILYCGVGKNGSSVARTSVLSPGIPLSLMVLPPFIIANKSPDNILTEHVSLYILAFGMVAAKVTNKLVVAHMTRSPMEYLDWSLFGPVMMFLNQYFDCVVPETWLLWMTLFWGTFDLMAYCSIVCLEICDHLNINLFTIPYPLKGSESCCLSLGTEAKPKKCDRGTNTPTRHKKIPLNPNNLALTEKRND